MQEYYNIFDHWRVYFSYSIRYINQQLLQTFQILKKKKKKIVEHHYHLRQTMFNNQSKFSKPTHQNLLEVEGDEGVLKEGLELEEGLEGAKRSWRTIRAIIRINGFLLDFLSTIFLCFFF